jgi:hypothetical protein
MKRNAKSHFEGGVGINKSPEVNADKQQKAGLFQCNRLKMGGSRSQMVTSG